MNRPLGIRRLLPSLFVLGLVSGCLDDELDPLDSFSLAELEREPLTAEPEPDPSNPADAGEAMSEDASGGQSVQQGFTGGESLVLSERSVFIGLERDFESFLSWPQLSLGAGPHVIADTPGEKTVYINALPVSGDTEYRVGTIIVKTVAPNEFKTSWQVHAMAKRGSGFNEKGAYEWEFFDLQLDETGVPRMIWRGEEAPDGESYRTTLVSSDGEETVIERDCNDCHITSNNDAILTPALHLDRF
jgi:hypothetical protein